ncbi:hypothetical protein [Streptomyces sp. NPDC088744]|uniref:hypothetical protein n=1 Tax=Streptomyces sp. NPDC088744 TaxID=3155061 RepID=UPI00344C2894
MSLEAMVWVLSGDAPVSDVNEYAVLGAMADKADPDGCGTWLSKDTIAARVHVSDETVKRCWRNMAKRGLIARGDQNLVRHYRADRRPVVYDLLIPYGWFSNVDRINAERERLGRPPLTRADRPPIAPAPPKKQRTDKGKPRPKKKTAPDQEATERGNSETPREETPPPPDGGTTSRQRGNYKSSAGELEDPQHSKSNQSGDTGNEDGPTVRPSVQVVDACASETDGRTDAVDSEGEQEAARPSAEGGAANSSSNEGAVPGSVSGDHRPATPGIEILRRVGRRREELTLAGKPLTDQARRLDGLLAASHDAGDPWMPLQLIEILSAPLNEPIRKSAGAVISARITALPVTPAAAFGMLPWQATGEGRRPAAEPSVPTAADRTVAESITRRTRGECPECGADSPGSELCGACEGWPACEGGCGRVLRDGGMCQWCEYDSHHAAIEAAAAEAGAEDGTCPGHDGPCGRPVLTLGLCGRCRIKAEEVTKATLDDWEAAKAQMLANVQAAEAEEGRQPDHAPF